MKKKLTILSAASLMTLAALAGCTTGGEGSSQIISSDVSSSLTSQESGATSESQESSSVVSSSAVSTSSKKGNFDGDVPDEGYEKDKFEDGKLIIKFFGVDIDSLLSQTNDTKMIMDVIENKFQVKFRFINGSATNWETVLNQYIGGGDVPDVFFHDMNQPMYSNLLDDDYLFNFEPYLNDYPNLKSAFYRYDVDKLRHLLGGGLYGLPILQDALTDRDIVNQHATYYRRDWYNALAAKQWKPLSGRDLLDPEDPNFNYLNFYDLMEGFTLGDPDGNGQNDTYGYALTKDGGTYWFYPILSMFNCLPTGWSWNEAQGKWLPDSIQDNCKEGLLYLADMFDKGYIARNYAKSLTQAEMKNEFINGYAGAMSFNANYNQGEGILELMEQYQTQTVLLGDVCRGMPVVTGKDGVKRQFGYANYYGYRSVNRDVSANKKMKIMEILNWMLSEEGLELLDHGIEGVHYTKDSTTGEYISLLGKNSSGLNKALYDGDCAPGIYRIKGLVSWSTIVPTDIKHYPEQMQLIQAWDPQYLVADPLAYAAVDTAFTTKGVTLDSKTVAAFQYIVGDHSAKERETKWNDFVADYLKDGKNYIAAKNQSAEELGIAHE